MKKRNERHTRRLLREKIPTFIISIRVGFFRCIDMSQKSFVICMHQLRQELMTGWNEAAICVCCIFRADLKWTYPKIVSCLVALFSLATNAIVSKSPPSNELRPLSSVSSVQRTWPKNILRRTSPLTMPPFSLHMGSTSLCFDGLRVLPTSVKLCQMALSDKVGKLRIRNWGREYTFWPRLTTLKTNLLGFSQNARISWGKKT